MTLYLRNGDVRFGTLSGNSAGAAIILNDDTLATDAADGGSEFDGAIRGTGGFTKADPLNHYNVLTLAGAMAGGSGGLMLSADSLSLTLAGTGTGELVNSGQITASSADAFATADLTVAGGAELTFTALTATADDLFGGLRDTQRHGSDDRR